MRIGPTASVGLAQLWAAQLTQTTLRVAAHRSSPTDRPVGQAETVTSDTLIRRPSRHTFDIRV